MTIRTKIIVAVLLTISVVLLGFGTIIYYQISDAEIAKLDAQLQAHGEKVASEIEENAVIGIFPNIPSLVEITTEGLPQTPFRLLDSSGSIIYSDTLLRRQSTHQWREVVSKPAIFETISISGSPWRSFWMPVEVEGDQFRYALQVMAPLTELRAHDAALRFRFIFTALISLLLSSFAIYLIVRSSFAPITTMIATAQDTSASDLTKRVPVPAGRDEVYSLATALNTMMDRITASFQSQKQFVADASHEFRTPLTVIQSETEFSRRRTKDKALRESLRNILTELDHLKKLTDDLLLLARLDSSNNQLAKEPLNLNQLLLECIRTVKRLGKPQQITLTLAPSRTVVVVADREKMRSVFVNLLDNAIRYSGPKRSARISLEERDRSVCISIRDFGMGIPPVELDKIFERFHRGPVARANEHGSGLGLAIVSKIIELHHGTISVESKVGKGSTFTVTIPLPS